MLVDVVAGLVPDSLLLFLCEKGVFCIKNLVVMVFGRVGQAARFYKLAGFDGLGSKVNEHLDGGVHRVLIVPKDMKAMYIRKKVRACIGEVTSMKPFCAVGCLAGGLFIEAPHHSA